MWPSAFWAAWCGPIYLPLLPEAQNLVVQTSQKCHHHVKGPQNGLGEVKMYGRKVCHDEDLCSNMQRTALMDHCVVWPLDPGLSDGLFASPPLVQVGRHTTCIPIVNTCSTGLLCPCILVSTLDRVSVLHLLLWHRPVFSACWRAEKGEVQPCLFSAQWRCGLHWPDSP